MSALRLFLTLIVFGAGQVLADGRGLEAILRSAGARFVFNHTPAGRALAHELAGGPIPTLETYDRLFGLLRSGGRGREARAIAERLQRIEAGLAREYPLEGAAWFGGEVAGARSGLSATVARLAEIEFEGGLRALLPAGAEGREAFLAGEGALAGMGRLEPESAIFRFIARRIGALSSWSEFPAINARQLGPMTRIPGAGGLGNAGVFRTELNGRAVVVKVSDPAARTERDVLNEARMMMVLNHLGLGAEFHGVVEVPGGAQGLVFGYVEGVAYPLHRSVTIPSGFLRRSHAREILRAGGLIDRAGIRYAPDMQFILTSDGRAVLVDPEYFRFEVPVNPPLELPFNPVENSRDLARGIVRRLEADAHL